MRVIVIGATGFVGSRVCQQLHGAGHDVIVVGRIGSNSQADRLIDVSDLSSFAALENLPVVDALINCSGIAHRFRSTSKDEYRKVNVEGVRNICNFVADRGIPRLIHLSSVLVYGGPTISQPVSEAAALAPRDDYAWSKAEGERVAKESSSNGACSLTILRPAPIIGEGSKGNVGRLIRAIAGRRFIWVGSGVNTRSFVYVGDIARSVEWVLKIGNEKAQVLNVVGGNITVREMVDVISRRLDRQPPSFKLPASLAKAFAGLAEHFPEASVVGRYGRSLETWLAEAVYSGEALAALGFQPQTSIREALEREVDHYLALT